MDWHKGNPRIELLRKTHQVFRLGKQGLDEDAEKANKDGKLNHQRAQAPHRAHTRFPVQPHGLLGYPGPVPAVPLLDFPHPGLQFAHPAHLPDLLQGEGKGHQPYQNGKGYDGQSHVVEAQNVQHHQGVEHGTDYYFVPESEKYTEVQGDS